jgi:hypothetical protein
MSTANSRTFKEFEFQSIVDSMEEEAIPANAVRGVGV